MADAWKTLSVALVANTVGYSSGLAKASADTKAFGKEVETAQTKAGDERSWLSASTAIAGIGVAAVAAGAVLFRIGEDFGNAFRTIRQETGATGKSLDGLQQSLKNVYAQRPESLQQVTDVIVALNRQLGLTGPQLETVAVAELRLASITKTDVSSVLQTTTALFNNYGIAASQQVDKLNELYRVHEKTGVAVTDLAQQMTTIGPVTRSLGLTFEQSAALVGSLSKSGVDASSTMMAFGRVLKEASAAGVTGSVYLGKVFDQIRQAPNATAAAGIAVQEFGARAARFSDLIRSGKLDFQSFAAALTGGSDTIGKSAIATQSWSAKVKIALHDVEVQLQPLGSKVFEGVVKGAAEVLPEIQKLITAGGKDLVAFFKELAPAGRDLVSAFQNLGPILRTAASAAEPFVKMLALVGAGAAVIAIRGLAAGLKDLTGFLDHNQMLVKALTASLLALGAIKAFNFLSDVGGAGLMVLNNVLLSAGGAMTSLSERATLFAGAIGQARLGDFEGALTSARGAAAGLGAAFGTFVVPAAAIYGIMNISSAMQKADQYAKSLAASFDKVSVLDTSAFQDNMSSLADKIAEIRQQIDHLQGDGSVSMKSLGSDFESAGASLLGHASEVDKLGKAYQALLTEQDKLAQKSEDFNTDLLGMSAATGLTETHVQALLKQFNIDPTQTGYAKGLAQLKANLGDFTKTTGVSTAQLSSFMDAMSPQEATDFAKAIAQVGTAMQSTMQKFGDLSTIDVSKGVSGGGIEKFYADKVKEAQTFVDNIRTAVQQGFDPAVIQQLMTAGPDAAGPILQAMVSDTSGALVKQVNAGVSALSSLSEQSINLARAAYQATTAPAGPAGDRMAAEYKNAVAAIIDAANGIPPDLIAKKLNLNPDQYNQLVTDFGDGLVLDLQTAVDGAPPVNIPAVNVPLLVNKDQAQQQLDAILHDKNLQGSPLMLQLGLNDDRARAATALWLKWASTQEGQAQLGADPKIGLKVLGDLIFGFDNATGVATLDANAAKAYDKYTLFVTKAGQVVVLPIDANLQAAEDRLNGFITDADRRSITVDVYTRTGQINAGGHSYGDSRWGNITAYAAGGITPAHITRHELMKYGEPETGGEAFVPRYGAYSRSRAVLDQAAGWYGMKVVPASWNGPTSVPAGPSGTYSGGHSTSVVVAPGAVQVGNVYSVDDFDQKMAAATDQLTQQISREMARR